jgi:sugar phosphate isomerase/epimerase
MNDYEFKMGVHLNETALPFEEAVGLAQELGARYVEYSVPPEELTEKHAAYCKRILDDAGLQTHVVGCTPPPFKILHIDEVEHAELPTHSEFVRDLDNLRRSMAFGKFVGAPQAQCSGFAWPGEFHKFERPSPTWSKRYAADGGIIPPAELEKIVEAFRIVADLADEHDIDVLLMVHPWEYVNTSRHYLEIVTPLDSPRFKAKWCPGDAMLSVESDTVTTGYENLRLYLTSLHLKDTRTIDGPSCKFEWCELGTGDPD